MKIKMKSEIEKLSPLFVNLTVMKNRLVSKMYIITTPPQ